MKKSAVALVILVALIGIYLLVQSRKNVVSADRPFIKVDSAAVTKLYMESSLDTVQLEKQGDKWVLTKPVNYPAAKQTVGMALGRFREMEKLSLISSKADRQEEFQVDAASSVKLVVMQSGEPIIVYFGKSSSTGGTSYARMGGSNDIWEVSGVYSPTFKRKAKDWRDKTITEVEPGSFRKFSIQYPDEALTVTLEDTTWKVDAGKVKYDAEKELVSRLTNLLSRLSTIDFADTLGPNFFDHPACHFVAELTDGSAIDFKLVPKDAEASQYFLRKAGANTDFVIYKSTAQVLMKHASDFRTPPESPKKEDKKASKKA